MSESVITCERCGGAWFKEERWAKLVDESFIQGGEMRRAGANFVYRCVDCYMTLDVSAFETPGVFITP